MSEFLSDEQFAAEAVKDGASRHARTLRAKRVGVDTGYMVGGATSPKTGTKFTERKIPVGNFTPADVANHLAEMHSHFPEDSSIHQGAWEADGDVVLDASNDIADRGHAQLTGEMRGEKAIFGVKEIKDFPLVNRSGRELFTAPIACTGRALRAARGLS